MTVPITPATLDALPPGAQATDHDGDVWRKQPTGRWSLIGGLPDHSGLVSKRLVELYGPIQAMDTTHIPGEGS